MQLATSVSILLDARDHLDKYGSRAADAGTPARDARFLMTRALNKLDSELALTQAAAMLLGLKAAGAGGTGTPLSVSLD